MNRLMMWIGAVLFAAAIQPRPAAAQTPENTESEIRSLDARRLAALTQGDVRSLDDLLAKDLAYTHASGWRQTKAEFLSSIRSGELKFHTFNMRDVSVRVYGDTVIVTGGADAKVNSKGQELDVRLLFLEVYVKEGGRWRLAAWQSTRSES